MQMKKQKETKDKYQSIVDGLHLIEDLLIPQLTPRVPGSIRCRAREIMQSFPTETEIKTMLQHKEPK